MKAFGERHSTTDIICTDGIPVDMRQLKSFQMNSDKTATFGAGVSSYEASRFILQYERAFKVMPAFGNITLGGAIGTSAHGSSLKFPSTLSQQVVKMTIVNGLGRKQVISSPEDLKSFRAHLGLLGMKLRLGKLFSLYLNFSGPLGIIVDVTMNTVPLYKVKVDNYIVSDEILTNGTAINWARTFDQVNLAWYPNTEKILVFHQTFVPANTAGNAYAHLIPSSTTEESVFSTLYKETAFNLSASNCQAASTLGKYKIFAVKTSISPVYPSSLLLRLI